MDRVMSYELNGTRIVLVDLSRLAPPEIPATIDAATPVVRSAEPVSIATTTKVDGASVNTDVINAAKAFAQGNEPHVRTAAVVGLSGLQNIVPSTVSPFTGRESLTCSTVEEAHGKLATAT